MLRVNRLTDYAVMLLVDLLQSEPVHPAAELAAGSGIPLPTVSKILKQLVRAEILRSVRGANGGYGFARSPAEISMAEIIEALEGPIAVTGCVEDGGEVCDRQGACPMSSHWNAVNVAIRRSLDEVRLIDLLPEARFMTRDEVAERVARRHAVPAEAGW